MSEVINVGTDHHGMQVLCQEYLDACIAALAVTTDGAPTRAFVSPGPPSWDCCPQLSVHAGGPVIADTAPLTPSLATAHRVADGLQLNMVLMTATVLRCAPDLDEQAEFPDPSEITAVAAQTNQDVWAIWNYLSDAKKALAIWPPKEREFSFDPAIAQAQEGGCCGWEIPIRVQLSGYKIVFP